MKKTRKEPRGSMFLRLLIAVVLPTFVLLAVPPEGMSMAFSNYAASFGCVLALFGALILFIQEAR